MVPRFFVLRRHDSCSGHSISPILSLDPRCSNDSEADPPAGENDRLPFFSQSRDTLPNLTKSAKPAYNSRTNAGPCWACSHAQSRHGAVAIPAPITARPLQSVSP